jgi:hypothetical protein
MLANELAVPLRARLGADSTNALLEALEQSRDEAVTTAIAACTDRFERRLAETSSALRSEIGGLRQDVRDGFAALRLEIAAVRIEVLKWSFVFWVGQLAAVAGMIGVLLRVLKP